MEGDWGFLDRRKFQLRCPKHVADVITNVSLVLVFKSEATTNLGPIIGVGHSLPIVVWYERAILTNGFDEYHTSTSIFVPGKKLEATTKRIIGRLLRRNDLIVKAWDLSVCFFFRFQVRNIRGFCLLFLGGFIRDFSPILT